jgi:hypothetical protein
VLAICDAVDWLPRSLRSVADAPGTARKKKPATPVGMTRKRRNVVVLDRKNPPFAKGAKDGAPSRSLVRELTTKY